MTHKFDPDAYRITVQKVIEEGETLFKATVFEFPDVAVFGESHAVVYGEVLSIIDRLQEMAIEHGKSVPAPESVCERYSGRVTLRMSKSLHARIAACASNDGESLNGWINCALAEAVGTHHRNSEINGEAAMFILRSQAKAFSGNTVNQPGYSSGFAVSLQ